MSQTRIESTLGHLVKALKTPTIGRLDRPEIADERVLHFDGIWAWPK